MQSGKNERFLILVRHSTVHMEKNKPSNEWSLSEEGRDRCRQFVPLIASYHPTLFVTSQEDKVIKTGMLLANTLRVPNQSAENLHEHDRRGSPIFASKQEFRTAIGRLFAYPEELVFSPETAAQATERFDFAIRDLIEQYH